MARIELNDECWNCGVIVRDDGTCPKCKEHISDDPVVEMTIRAFKVEVKWDSNKLLRINEILSM